MSTPWSAPGSAALASAAGRTRQVFLRDMVLPARIGVYLHEQGGPQRVRINVNLAVDDDRAQEGRDELARVVDYGAVAETVRRIVAAGHVKLAETLAERIAAAVLADPRVAVARVRVEKLDVFPDTGAVGVEVERVRPSGKSSTLSSTDVLDSE